MFYDTTLNLANFLKEFAPAVQEGEKNSEVNMVLDAWKHSNFICKECILNGLDNILYGVYSSKDSAKNLWDSIKKYKIEDVETKKFIVGKFLYYKMV